MGIKDLIPLPKIGDLITFTGVWDKLMSKDGKYPHGIVTDILEYDYLMLAEGKAVLIGTLAFPLDEQKLQEKKLKVFLVRWCNKEENLDNSFRYINEEWFYNKSFTISTRKT